jgi:CHAT domain-containing protein
MARLHRLRNTFQIILEACRFLALRKRILWGIVIGVVLTMATSSLALPPPTDLVHQGRQYLDNNQPAAAIKAWRVALAQYQRLGNIEGTAGTYLNIANAEQSLNRYDLACQSLFRGLQQSDLSACDPSKRSANSTWITSSLFQRPLAQPLIENLGGVLTRLGQYNLAETLLSQALQVYPSADGIKLNLALVHDFRFRAGVDRYRATTADLVRVEQLQILRQEQKQATQLYQTLNQTTSSVRLRAKLNELGMLSTLATWSDPTSSIPFDALRFDQLANQLVATDWSVLRPSQALNAQLSLVTYLSQVKHFNRIAFDLTTGILKAAQTQQWHSLLSLTYRLQGSLYAQTGQLVDAQAAWRTALKQAQLANDHGLQWQAEYPLANSLRVQNRSEALTHFQAAGQALEQLRTIYGGLNPELQISFNSQVAPFFRDYATTMVESKDLEGAIHVIERLQANQFENYLECGRLNLQPLSSLLPTNPVTPIYIWTGRETTHVIVQHHNQIRHHSLPFATLRSDITALNKLMQAQAFRSIPEPVLQQLTQRLYQNMIAPVADSLPAKGQTLVFIADIEYQGIPFSFLHDGKSYLVDRFDISTGLPQARIPRALSADQKRVLVGAISTQAPSFTKAQLESLPGVEQEVGAIQSIFKNTKVIANQRFQEGILSEAVRAGYPILHLATHGVFSGNPEATKLYFWDKPLGLNELGELFRQAASNRPESNLELLVLSSCSLAPGDNGLEFGAAGLGFRAGARSTLAGLWPVEDRATAFFMERFYQGVAKGLPKVEALRQAQLALKQSKDYSHPYYWGPWLLLGSWR